VEELLESFVTAALGLELKSRVDDLSQLPEMKQMTACENETSKVCAAWCTTEGRVIICAWYHPEHSRKMLAHVLWLEWWIPPNTHHEGWWRVDPKWPRNWVKGQGTPYT
jgi:hypothetical protein